MKLSRFGGLLVAVVLPFLLTGVAGANPGTSLTLSVSSPGWLARSVALECDPPGGTHPNAMDACMELHLVAGDLDTLAYLQEPTSCTLEYRPVVATARGSWYGRPVSWTHTYGNDCALHAETGPVFDF